MLRRRLTGSGGPARVRWLTIPGMTKGTRTMMHLDVYARRDPQLVPYLLREVDIEYKRKCRKVAFAFWLAVGIFLSQVHTAVTADVVYLAREYAEYVQIEQSAKDDDALVRRRTLAKLINVVNASFARNQKWSKDDSDAAMKIFDEVLAEEEKRGNIASSSRAAAEPTK